MNKKEIIGFLKEHKKNYMEDGFIIVGLFGSYARGDFDKDSDIDLIYEIDNDKFFKKYGGFLSVSKVEDIKKELEKKLKKSVDLVSFDTMDKSTIKTIKKDMIIA